MNNNYSVRVISTTGIVLETFVRPYRQALSLFSNLRNDGNRLQLVELFGSYGKVLMDTHK